jgi:predicted ester cyclase
MERDDMIRAVEEHYRSFWQGDLNDFDRQLAPDFTDRDALGDRTGPAPAKEYAEFIRPASSDMTVTVEQAIVEGDWVAIRATWEGTHTGPFLGREPTGRRIGMKGMVFWRFDRQGRIAERWAQIDVASMLAQFDEEQAPTPT